MKSISKPGRNIYPRGLGTLSEVISHHPQSTLSWFRFRRRTMFAVYQKAATSIPNLCEKGKISTYFAPGDVKKSCTMKKFDQGEKHDKFYDFPASQFVLNNTYRYKSNSIHSRNDDKVDSRKRKQDTQVLSCNHYEISLNRAKVNFVLPMLTM